MKIEVKDGKIVCTAYDWRSLTDTERRFLSDCSFAYIWTSFDEDGDLMFCAPETERKRAFKIERLTALAARHKIELTDDYYEVYKQAKELADEERERELKAEETQRAIKRWEYRKQTGCDGCRSCYRMGDGWFKCLHSGDALDFRFMEKYDPKTKAMELFHEVGEPNEHCKDYIGIRIEKKGI